jgi:hypothetical protein
VTTWLCSVHLRWVPVVWYRSHRFRGNSRHSEVGTHCQEPSNVVNTRVSQKSLCTYRRHWVYSESPCRLIQIHFSHLLKLQQMLEMAPTYL